MDTVIIESAGEPARIVQLAGFPCRIGRDRNCAVMLANWRVARAHAELHRLEHGVKIVDCGSLGGSTINGERFVEFGPLSENDVVQIAGFRLRFEMRGAGSDGGDSDLPGAESSAGILSLIHI